MLVATTQTYQKYHFQPFQRKGFIAYQPKKEEFYVAYGGVEVSIYFYIFRYHKKFIKIDMSNDKKKEFPIFYWIYSKRNVTENRKPTETSHGLMKY